MSVMWPIRVPALSSSARLTRLAPRVGSPWAAPVPGRPNGRLRLPWPTSGARPQLGARTRLPAATPFTPWQRTRWARSTPAVSTTLLPAATAPIPDDQARAGYDLVTGLGTPVASGLVPALVALAPAAFSLSVTPASSGSEVYYGSGAFATYTVTVSPSSATLSSLSVSPPLNGASYSVVSPGTYTLTVNTSASTPVGYWPLTITGTSGSQSSHNRNPGRVALRLFGRAKLRDCVPGRHPREFHCHRHLLRGGAER